MTDNRIIHRFRHPSLTLVAVASVVAVLLGSSPAVAQPALTLPRVPAEIEAPPGNTPFLEGHAEGTQNYICLPSDASFSWTFLSPQATLSFEFKLFGRDVGQQIITHFLSPNASEFGRPRVTWQSSVDSSAVWARLSKSYSDRDFVAPGAIPWLLLERVGLKAGPTGGDILATTSFVQRINTYGGVAPSAGCSAPADVGATQLVPYTADYIFYRASSPD
jgi:hypothetical protein